MGQPPAELTDESGPTCARSNCQQLAKTESAWKSESGRVWYVLACGDHLSPAPPMPGFALVGIERISPPAGAEALRAPAKGASEAIPKTYTTKRGERINAHSDLCAGCSNFAAQSATYWTDDANFEGSDGDGWDEAARFAQIQREITNQRQDCRENCGRVEVTSPEANR